MSGPIISRVKLGAAHDGEAEMVLTILYENGGETQVALDGYAADHLMAACAAGTADALVGQGWQPVRDALQASSNRFITPDRNSTHQDRTDRNV